MTITIVGWTILIASWILPRFIKNQDTRRFVGAGLSALATGIFLGALLSKHCI